jgi:hypothetical protein
MRSVCKLSSSNAAFSLMKKLGREGKTNTNVRMTWWNMTICSLLSLTFTAGYVTYKTASALSHSLYNYLLYFTHLCQQCHNSKCVIFQERLLKVLKCYNFLRAQQRHNRCPPASFANCVMTRYLLKMQLQTFLSIPITQKCQILSFDTLVANEWFVSLTSCFS